MSILNLVFIGPRFSNEGVQSGIGVRTVLGDDDRLDITCPALELLLLSRFGGSKITSEDIPAVVAVQHQNITRTERRGISRAVPASR
jgi:hypothetical protein